MDTKRLRAVIALLFAFALIAASCGDDDDGGDGDTSTTAAEDAGAEDEGGEDEASSTTAAPEGEDEAGPPASFPETDGAVFIASQWPECTNPITSCANASWLSWVSSIHVLPRLMEVDLNGEYVPSPVLAGDPEAVENDDGTFTVTYSISPDAVWDDGTPITSTDIKFTQDAKIETTGTLSTTGYDLVTEVDDSDPATAVITFSEPYAAWPDMYGGATEYFLKADAFESTDVADEMNEGIPFSGGPWKSESFNQEQHVLVPNENYWVEDRIPQISEVVFVPREDTETQITAMRSGEAAVSFPQPFPGINEAVGDLNLTVGPGAFIEGIWFNQQSPNSNNVAEDVNVRKAVLYALDRDVIAAQALSFMEEPTVLNCIGWNPSYGEWCDDSDFSDITQDGEMVTTLLEESGWTREDGDECWSKDGEDLNITWNTVAGNQRREDVQAVVQEMTKEFGICWTIENHDPGELFENMLPTLQFGPAALYANSTSPDPTISQLYRSDQIPSEENEFSGQNSMAYANPELDELLDEADRTIDPAQRLELVHQIGDIVAEDVVWIPLYLLPNSTIWDDSQISGPIDEYNSHVYSSFANMYAWTLAG